MPPTKTPPTLFPHPPSTAAQRAHAPRPTARWKPLEAAGTSAKRRPPQGIDAAPSLFPPLPRLLCAAASAARAAWNVLERKRKGGRAK